jgi:hypothetical protein
VKPVAPSAYRELMAKPSMRICQKSMGLQRAVYRGALRSADAGCSDCGDDRVWWFNGPRTA